MMVDTSRVGGGGWLSQPPGPLARVRRPSPVSLQSPLSPKGATLRPELATVWVGEHDAEEASAASPSPKWPVGPPPRLGVCRERDELEDDEASGPSWASSRAGRVPHHGRGCAEGER